MAKDWALTNHQSDQTPWEYAPIRRESPPKSPQGPPKQIEMKPKSDVFADSPKARTIIEMAKSSVSGWDLQKTFHS